MDDNQTPIQPNPISQENNPQVPVQPNPTDQLATKKPSWKIIPALAIGLILIGFGTYFFFFRTASTQVALDEGVAKLINPGSVKVDIESNIEGAKFSGAWNTTNLALSTHIEFSIPDLPTPVIFDFIAKDDRFNMKLEGAQAVLGLVQSTTGAYEDLIEFDAVESAIKEIESWKYIDSEVIASVAKEMGSTSTPEIKFSNYITESDFKIIADAYSNNSFIEIVEEFEEEINGEDLTKVKIKENREVAIKFAEEIQNAEFSSKELNDATDNFKSSVESSGENPEDGLYIWVSRKDKEIRQISPLENEGEFKVMFSEYGSAEITAPSDATPFNAETLTALGEALFASFGSLGGGVQADARDTERRTDINAIYEQLEFYAAKNGFYPTAANLADTAWVSENLKGLDAEALVDPSGGGYTYTVTPLGCDNTATNCESFTLSTTLEDGNTFSRQSLD